MNPSIQTRPCFKCGIPTNETHSKYGIGHHQCFSSTATKDEAMTHTERAALARELAALIDNPGKQPEPIDLIEAAAHLRYLAQMLDRPEGWITHHDEPMVFVSRSECAEYCHDDEQPIPLFSLPVDGCEG